MKTLAFKRLSQDIAKYMCVSFAFIAWSIAATSWAEGILGLFLLPFGIYYLIHNPELSHHLFELFTSGFVKGFISGFIQGQ